MRFTYFMYNERLDEQILTSQVFKLWTDYVKKYTDSDVEIIVFQNIFHYFLNYRAGLILKNDFNLINIKIYPFALPTRGFFLNSFFLGIHKLLFKASSIVFKNKIVISRGYLASYILTQKAKFNTISDLRSLFVRENIGVRWKLNSREFKNWLEIEKNILELSKAIITVNNSMSNYLESEYINNKSKISVIPIYTSNSFVKNNSDLSSKNKINLFYVGSLGKSKWNDIDVYLDFFRSISNYSNKEIFKVILIFKDENTYTNLLVNFLKSSGLDYSIFFNLKHEEVIDKMKFSDIGLILARPFDDASCRTGIKSIEYISNNLTLLASSCLTDVKELVESNDIGFVIEDVKLNEIEIHNIINNFIKKSSYFKSNVSKLYNEKFSKERLLKQYSDLLNSVST